MIKTTYADTCVLHNTDRGQDVEAEVMEFRPGMFLSVSVHRSVKIKLLYNQHNQLYIGSMAGYEFTSPGPKETVTYQGRR